MNRRSFLSSSVAVAAATAVKAAPLSPFSDADFGYSNLCALGNSRYGVGDPGKLLALTSKIKPGDFDSAWASYRLAGQESLTLAEAAAKKRHNFSAREAYLAAASYFRVALRFVDFTDNPDRMLACWQDYAQCWAAAAELFDPPIERLEIPYEGTSLTGWLLRADNSSRRRPLVIIHNGADGMEVNSYILGAAGALARGYNCLIYNGPGQSDSLFVRKLYFRPDWERVITPVVDAMLLRREVDPKRIALVGISQGGYWAPRALAFEHRIAAGVADPGVWDVSAPWLLHLPQSMRALLESKDKSTFDQYMQMDSASNARSRGMLRFRMRPFGMTSYYDAYQAVQTYNLAEVAGQIRCPMLLTAPEGEQFFPGQAQKLYDALHCPKTIVHLTHDQGAGEHCEVAAPGYRDYCIYNWLDDILG